MKKDVNFVFFILIIATVVSFAGFTAYYQVSFKNINAEYQARLTELEKVTTDILEKKKILLETNLALDPKLVEKLKGIEEVLSKSEEDLIKTQTGREELGEKYGVLKDERDYLQVERDTLTENLALTKSQLASTQSQLETTKGLLSASKAEAEKWENKYESCKEDLESCEAT